MVEAKYNSDDDFPDDLRVDDAFLTEMETAKKAIRPLNKASFVMQRDSKTLADVFFMMGTLHQEFVKHPQHSSEFVSLSEKRWKNQEQPLILLAFMLHPKYTPIFRMMKMFDDKANVLSMTTQ